MKQPNIPISNIGMVGKLPLRGELTIPNWLTGKSIVFFFLSMFICWIAYGYVPAFDLIVVAGLSLVLFFYGGMAMGKSWERKNERTFVRNVFIAALVIRLLWMLYSYFFFYPDYFGDHVGDKTDTDWYMPFGKAIAEWISGGFGKPLNSLLDEWDSSIDDTGYPMWLGVLYWIVGVDNDVFVPYVFKCILGAYCAVSIYRVAKRHYGEGTARLAAIFICVNPNMIYWCASMFKEAEMVFLVCLAIDNFDRVLTSGQKYTFKNLLPGVLAAMALFFFRSALSIVIFLAVFAHIVMASSRVMSYGKKIIAGLLVGLVLAVGMGDRLRSQTRQLLESAQSDQQQVNMEWRAKREGGNAFAKYASATVFAPMIFTIPFPTMNAPYDGQYRQIQLSGGSYIKNILSFFVIIVLISMLISGEWRKNVFLLAYTVGYHLVLVMSNFAHSGRFHMPVWPMLMLFAALGIQMAKTNPKIRKWYPMVLVLEVVVCLAWNWFKLKGRGMI